MTQKSKILNVLSITKDILTWIIECLDKKFRKIPKNESTQKSKILNVLSITKYILTRIIECLDEKFRKILKI